MNKITKATLSLILALTSLTLTRAQQTLSADAALLINQITKWQSTTPAYIISLQSSQAGVTQKSILYQINKENEPTKWVVQNQVHTPKIGIYYLFNRPNGDIVASIPLTSRSVLIETAKETNLKIQKAQAAISGLLDLIKKYSAQSDVKIQDGKISLEATLDIKAMVTDGILPKEFSKLANSSYKLRYLAEQSGQPILAVQEIGDIPTIYTEFKIETSDLKEVERRWPSIPYDAPISADLDLNKALFELSAALRDPANNTLKKDTNL